ncbi:restriction endonuclease subunit S [Pseudomonas sp. UBA7530]|uniref:restriction endonuclease subunit S n=1 Tax=Pseudomonas sp. UBA7530 TaxID=1947341 RepID=UPI0025F96E5F|nr:restriction endonuclease subunit S [Pseudomonas sp. UBA7530]
MSEWQVFLVEDIAAPGKNSLATGPFGSSISSKFFVEQGVPVIRGGNLSTEVGKRLNDEGLVFVSKDKAEEFSRSVVGAGDLIFTCWGTINQVGLIDSRASHPNYVISNKQMKLSVDRSKADPLFIYYLFSGPEKQQEILNNGIGAAVPGFNLGQLRRMAISLPKLEEQKAIASVLSNLDDKIDLLHRQNKTLETIAETLFRQWFVEEAQESWATGKLSDEFDFTMGQSPPGDSFNTEYIGIPMFQGNADFGFRFPKNRVFTTEPKRFAQPMDTLISVRAPVGAQNMANQECCIGRGIAAFRYRSNSNFYTYTYFKLRSLMTEIMKFNDEGTVFGSISKSDLETITSSIPTINFIERFENEAKPINDKIIRSCEQINSLEKLRDTLLPKLVSGEVRVSY